MELPDDDLATLAGDEDTEDKSPEVRNGGDNPSESHDDDASDPVDEAVVAALINETSVPADQFSPQLTLRTDFDLDNIGLYAVIAEIEQELAIEIPDTDIDKAVTLGDLLMVVRSYKSS